MKHRFWYILSAFLLTLLVAACKQSTDVVPTQYNALLDVYNATDTAFNFYQNGTRINTSANIPSNNSTRYLTVPVDTPGTSQNFAIKYPPNIYGSSGSSITPSVTIFSKALILHANKFYSLFICGKTAANTFLHLDADTIIGGTGYINSQYKIKDSVIRDSVFTINPNYPKVRFVNTSPSLGALSVAVNGTLKFSSVSYPFVSNFVTITPTGISSTTATISIYSAGNTTTPIAVSAVPAFVAGNMYTIFVTGSSTSSGTVANVGLAVNNF